MARNEKSFLLFLLAALLRLLQAEESCSSLPRHGLTCLNDYNNNITCEWNSTNRPDVDQNASCTISASRMSASGKLYNSSCKLEPADVATPGLRRCSMIFKRTNEFQSFQVWSIKLSCEPPKQTLIQILYKPRCHVKMNPAGRPKVNFTTVSWSLQLPRRSKIQVCSFQLQWKQKNQAWEHTPVQRNETVQCNSVDEVQLDPNQLVQGESYEARVRLLNSDEGFQSTWSDWSPVASWVSPVGTTKQPPTGGSAALERDVSVGTAASAAFALLMAIMLFRRNKNTWVYVVKKIRGPPLPNPAKFFLRGGNLQPWLWPQFTTEAFHQMSPVDIVPVEVTSPVDAITPCGPEKELPETMKYEGRCQSTSSSFSNPSYSHLCPPPISSLTAGSLQPCAPDSPYGPIGGPGDGANTEQDGEEERGKDMEIQLLFSKGSETGESMQVSSDYESAEKIQIQSFRVQSPDSGLCSEEEVSQESLEEADDVTESHAEWSEGKEGEGRNVALQTLLGNIGRAGFSKGSIQVCSDYERVETLQAESPGLRSPDSGVGSGAEEQVSQESLEDVDGSTESTSFLFPPSCDTFPCSVPSFTPKPANLCEPGLSPALRPLLPSHFLDKILTSNSRMIEPSADGYMPVRQEQN